MALLMEEIMKVDATFHVGVFFLSTATIRFGSRLQMPDEACTRSSRFFSEDLPIGPITKKMGFQR